MHSSLQETFSKDFKSVTQEYFDNLFQKEQNIIGKGTFGDVYKGTTKEGIKVAIKKFNNQATKDTLSLSNQIHVIQSLNHPSFIKFLGCYKVNNHGKKSYYMITQFAENGNLETQKQRIKTMQLKDKLLWCWQIANGIEALHQRNLMHRDIKPQNILVDKDFNLKICDFGCCKQDNISLTFQTQVGTPIYMDPKVQTGKYTKKCDIYSLGLVMFFVLSGRQIFANVRRKDQLIKQRTKFFQRTDDYLKQLPVQREIKQLLKACVKQNQFSRIDIKDLVLSLQHFSKKYTVSKESSMKSTLIFTQQSDKLSLIDTKVMDIISLKPEYSHKQSVQRVKKQLLGVLLKAKKKAAFIPQVSVLNMQNYKKQIIAFLCICYYIRCMSCFKKWVSRQVQKLPKLFDKIDFEDIKQEEYSSQKNKRFNDSVFGQYVPENSKSQLIFGIDVFNEQTKQLFKKIAKQQILKYQKEFFRISSQIKRRIPVIGGDLTHLLKEIINQVDENDYRRIDRFSEQDIRKEYYNFFIMKIAKDKESENMKNSQVFEIYKSFREFINNFEDVY